MTEDAILTAWRKAIKAGEEIRHGADWAIGTVVGKSRHPMYDLDVDCSDVGVSPVYARYVYPGWWAAPEWANLGKATPGGR